MIQITTRLLALIPPELRLEIEGKKAVGAGTAECAPLLVETHHAFQLPVSLERGVARIGTPFRRRLSAYLLLEDNTVLLWRKDAKTSRHDLRMIFAALRDVRKLHVITNGPEAAWPEKSAGSEWPWHEVGR